MGSGKPAFQNLLVLQGHRAVRTCTTGDPEVAMSACVYKKEDRMQLLGFSGAM